MLHIDFHEFKHGRVFHRLDLHIDPDNGKVSLDDGQQFHIPLDISNDISFKSVRITGVRQQFFWPAQGYMHTHLSTLAAIFHRGNPTLSCLWMSPRRDRGQPCRDNNPGNGL